MNNVIPNLAATECEYMDYTHLKHGYLSYMRAIWTREWKIKFSKVVKFQSERILASQKGLYFMQTYNNIEIILRQTWKTGYEYTDCIVIGTVKMIVYLLFLLKLQPSVGFGLFTTSFQASLSFIIWLQFLSFFYEIIYQFVLRVVFV